MKIELTGFKKIPKWDSIQSLIEDVMDEKVILTKIAKINPDKHYKVNIITSKTDIREEVEIIVSPS